MKFVHEKGSENIVDTLHDTLPNMYKYKDYKDLIFIGILIPFIYARNPLEIIIRILGLFMTIVFIRSLVITTTILPKIKQCSRQTLDWKALFLGRGNCYDLSLSGHFSLGFISTLVLYQYDLISPEYAVLFNVANAAIILLTRSHYTIDIIVGFFATLIVFQNNLSIFHEKV